MCKKAVHNYSHALEFVPESFTTQRMLDKAALLLPSTIKPVPKCFMAREISDKSFIKYFSSIWFFSWSV